MLGAAALVGVASFTPPTIHSLGARVVSGLSRRVYNTVITNVPGPQFPLYAGGALMLTAYPVVPLARGQAVSIGLTSYNGGVYFGLNADRDAMPDVDVLAQCIDDSVAEMLATVTPTGRPRRAKRAVRIGDSDATGERRRRRLSTRRTAGGGVLSVTDRLSACR